MEKSSEKQPREHIRIRLREGAQAEVSICHIQGEGADSASSTVLLHNMSPAGLRFQSHLRFPVSKSYLLQFSITLDEWQFCLLGHVVWRRKEDNYYVYGCTFIPDEEIRKAIMCALLAKLQAMSPRQVRIHELYRRLTYKKESSLNRLDVKG
ncbi:PilZ domain-containing protein [Paenibacillus sp. OV219]|uniref:PilZ domain-containing protein n=1 Tax=Paenibacillus sp. OV219 TaxID=1884377 RepID=UPI0008C72A24|nr:PilZ domain-containing protein [Paenibacillus sp. OV219]SEO14437.1 PilZ domain-containing protein [Paenibacillus sp. OV219]